MPRGVLVPPSEKSQLTARHTLWSGHQSLFTTSGLSHCSPNLVSPQSHILLTQASPLMLSYSLLASAYDIHNLPHSASALSQELCPHVLLDPNHQIQLLSVHLHLQFPSAELQRYTTLLP